MNAPVVIGPAKASKLLGAIRLLASDKPGDVVNAGSAIERLVGADKLAELVASACQTVAPASAPPRAAVAGAWAHFRDKQSGFHRPLHERARMARYSPHINDWERGFLNDMIDRRSFSSREEAKLKDILRKSEGPNSIREKSVAQKALAVLVDHGWLVKVDGSHKVNGTMRREVYSMRSN